LCTQWLGVQRLFGHCAPTLNPPNITPTGRSKWSAEGGGVIFGVFFIIKVMFKVPFVPLLITAGLIGLCIQCDYFGIFPLGSIKLGKSKQKGRNSNFFFGRENYWSRVNIVLTRFIFPSYALRNDGVNVICIRTLPRCPNAPSPSDLHWGIPC
jgi:hypothetical protein